MRDRSRRREGLSLVAALVALACLWFGGGGCSNDDINFPGNIPGRTPTNAPTATPTENDS
jgi:hypothetical protein